MENLKLEQLDSKQRAVARTSKYKNFENLVPSLLNELAHEVLPGFNSSQDHTLENLRSVPDCSISYPRPIYISSSHPNLFDPCHQRSREYFRYFTTLRRYHSFFKVHQKRKLYKTAMRKGFYPSLVLRFAELLELNPDPYFSGRYDWYFTGGNLDVVDGRDLVIHVTGNNLDTLVISDISDDAAQQILTPRLINDIKRNQKIFEIQTMKSSPEIIFSVRQKHAISIYTYDDGNLTCNHSFTQPGVPYISSANDPYSKSSFVTSDLEKVVRLWNVEKSTTKPIQILFNSDDKKNSEKDQNWNCVRHFNRDTYAFTGLYDFTLLDARMPFDPTNHKLGSVKSSCELCERICGMCTSGFENLIYIGTSHKVFAVDVRYIGKEINDNYIVIRWTHQMNQSPLMLRAHRKDNYELVTSASPINGDVRFYENIVNKDDKYTSPCMPYMPPSLLEAYDIARTQGKCLNPTANLKNRISCCTTGMNFLKQDGNLFTLLSTSNGDVFSQKIEFGGFKAPSKQETVTMMDQFERNVIEVTKCIDIKLNITKVDDFSGISKVFRCERLDRARRDILEEPKRPHRLLKWQKSFQELNEYKDALVPDLLSIWDIDEDEKKEGPLEIEAEESAKVTQIEEWINQAQELINEPPMVSINHRSFLSSTQNVENFQNPFDISLSLSKTPTLIHAKPKSKTRSRYVQGF